MDASGEGNKGYSRSYSYDRIGNMTYKSDVGTYVYNYADKPHAARQAGNISMEYDLLGNMTKRAHSGGTTLDISWNPDNRPHLIRKDGSPHIRFTYDSAGMRVRKENLRTGSITTYFGDYELRGSTGVFHLFANGQRVASVRTDGKVQYYHANHLGSASLITDLGGSVRERIEYYPFGAYRDRQDLDASFPDVNYTFTGQEDDDETGLYNYNARLYDPELGRFISADSIVPEPGSLQAFNRYSYCANNPLIYVDPSGHFPWVAFAAAMFIGAASEAAFAAINDGDVLAGAMKGAFSAGVMFVTGVYLGGTGVIAITEAGQEVVKNLPAAVAAHMTAGATTGAFDTLVSGGDLGQNIMVSAISAGMAKGLGNYLPGGLTGNSCVDFGIGLAGHAAIGGISGGGTATLFGGNFGEGFEQGAIAGGYGYIFNRTMSKFLSQYKKGTLSQYKGWAYDGKAWTQIYPNAPWPFENDENQLKISQEKTWKVIDEFYNNPASETFYGTPDDLRRPTSYFPIYGPIEKTYGYGRKLWNLIRHRAPGAPQN